MVGPCVFGVLIAAGFVAFFVAKVRWSRQPARKWATTAAGEDTPRK